MKKFDLVVIGSGPAGEKAAVKAAYFGKSVAIIEKGTQVGGAGVNTGTLPSKTLKETALYFSGKNDKGLYGMDKEFSRETSIRDFMYRKDHVVLSEAKEMNENLIRHKVEIINGLGEFEDDHVIKVKGKTEEKVYGENILIATGSYPHHPSNIPFDRVRIHDSDSILGLERFPESICIVGAGVIGCEYATIFATMGKKVYLVNHTDEILGFLDKEISKALVEQMELAGVEILFNTTIENFTVPEKNDELIQIPLKSGEKIEVDMFLFAAGRSGNTHKLCCDKAGVKIGKRGVIEVDDDYRSSVSHIFAVGDVIGFPALASTSMDQGRVAVSHMFDIGDLDHLATDVPYGIYTVPEVSCVGLSERDAKLKKINYCTGIARFSDMPRGKILGVKHGFLKLVFRKDDLVIIGVHIIGNLAAEIIHFGVTLVENKKTLHQVIGNVFNYPTLHDLYKYASYDGLGNLSGHKIKT